AQGARPRAGGHLRPGSAPPRLRALPGRHRGPRQLPGPDRDLPRHAAARLRSRPAAAARPGDAHGAPRAGPPSRRRRAGRRRVGPVIEPPIEELSLATVMAALSDPARIEIVRVLAAEGERTCGTFDLGLSKATRSHHFKVLREAGLTHTRAEGTHRHISLRR